MGKSAIVEGLAQLIVKQQTSPALFNKRIVSVDLATMMLWKRLIPRAQIVTINS